MKEMPEKYIMGLDIGTTECKASLFDASGRLVRQASYEYQSEKTAVEIDGEAVWKKVREVISSCNGGKKPYVEGICITSFGETVVLVDSKLRSLGKSILYASGGCEKECAELCDAIGADTIYKRTGLIPHPMYTLNRLMWYRRQCPDIWKKTRYCLFFSSFIAMKLGAACVAENTQAARSMAYDLEKDAWNEELLTAAGVEPDKMPAIVHAGDVIGEVDAQLADELGFGTTPRIIAGGQDQPCVALGMGAVKGGDAVYGLGTVECMSVVLDKKLINSKMRDGYYVCSPHVVPGKFITYGVLYSGGNVITLIRDHLFCKDGDKDDSGVSVYRLMYRELDRIQTDLIVAPHFFGMGTPVMNLNAGAAIDGLRASCSRQEFLAAVIEGLSFDMRLNIENMLEAGVSIEKIMTAGGGAKSREGVQLRCNALHRELVLTEDIQAGARGTFLIAAKALGWALEKTKGSARECHFVPDASAAERYDEKYIGYRRFTSSDKVLR